MLGSHYNRSSRSLNALSDDWDPVPVAEWSRHKYCSSSMNVYPTDTSLQSPLQGNGNGAIAAAGAFDPFVTASPLSATGGVGPVSTNPYAHDPAALGGATFFASQTGFQQPVRVTQPSTVSIGLIQFHCRSNIIFMPPSALTIRTLLVINATFTTSSSPTISVKNCRRKLQLLYKHYPVG